MNKLGSRAVLKVSMIEVLKPRYISLFAVRLVRPLTIELWNRCSRCPTLS